MELEKEPGGPTMTLEIWSHSHVPPLQPPPDLKYDLRKIPNPPKHLRTGHDGRWKHLRQSLQHEVEFQKTLDRAKREIEEACFRRFQGLQQPGDASMKDGSDIGTDGFGLQSRNETARQTQVDDRDLVIPETLGDLGRQEAVDERNDPPNDLSASTDNSHGNVSSIGNSDGSNIFEERPLRVSCFCHAGQHRSVAFAEELAALAWPKDWAIIVKHRDIGNGHSSSKKKKRNRVSRLAFDAGDEEIW